MFYTGEIWCRRCFHSKMASKYHKQSAHCKNLPHISTKKNQVQLGCTSYFELNYI